LEPWAARRDLPGVRLLVKPPLAGGLPLEVLHRIGDVNLRALDARLGERLVQQSSGGADERSPREVLVVAGNLPHEKDPRAYWPLPEDGLRAGAPERAGPAAARELAQTSEGRARRDEACGGAGGFVRRPCLRRLRRELAGSAGRHGVNSPSPSRRSRGAP